VVSEKLIGHISFSISHFSFVLAYGYHYPRKKTSLQKEPHKMKREDGEDSQLLADQLEERLIDFAVRIIKLSNRLPKTPAGKHIAGQILRCGTSPAPNYGEARCAESRADFIQKTRIVLKELNETSIWLRIIERSELLKADLLIDIIRENGELCKIFAASLKTARRRTNEK